MGARNPDSLKLKPGQVRSYTSLVHAGNGRRMTFAQAVARYGRTQAQNMLRNGVLRQPQHGNVDITGGR